MSEQLTELGFQVDVIEDMEREGRWPDLSRLEKRRPDILKAVVWLLSAGLAVKTICKKLSLSPCTVNRIRHDPKWEKAVVSEKATLVEMFDEVLVLKAEQLRDEAREGKLPNIFDSKLIFDMRQLLSGGVTARVEVKASQEEEDFMRFMMQARLADKQGSGMVFDAEILPQSAIRELAPVPTPPCPGSSHPGDSASLALNP